MTLNNDLLEGTTEEIKERCTEFLKQRRWRLEQFTHIDGQCIDFVAKTDAFGDYHYLNRKGFRFGGVHTWKIILFKIIEAKLELLVFEFGALGSWAGFREIKVNPPQYLGEACIFMKYQGDICIELTDAIVNEKGYDLLKAALIEDAKEKGFFE